MSALAKIKRGIKGLVERHGAEAGVCAKVAVAALMPGGGGLPEVVRALCDYVGAKGQELTDERVLEGLGALQRDQAHVALVIERLGGQMSDTLAQMSAMARFNVPEEALSQLVQTAIATRQELSAVREELMGLQPELSFIQEQNEAILRQQAFAGDVLSQVKDSVSAALGFCAPLLSEGVPADKTLAFLQAHMSFQRCLVRGEMREAVEALKALRAISSTSDTVKVCEIALRAMRRDFEGAERVAQSLSPASRTNVRVQAMTRGVASLTRGARQPAQDVSQHVSETSPNASSPNVSSPNVSDTFGGSSKKGALIGGREWELIDQIGRGGMGEVWSVKNRHNEKGALKLMAQRLSADVSFVSRFEAEILALKRVRHRSVVEVLDWGRERAGAWFLVMELIEGASLGSKLRSATLGATEARTLLIELLKGLVACHEAGVVHRDIKPDNIMLRKDGSPVLIDFGIAHQEEGHTGGMTQVATVVYAPPEQLRGEQVGPEADLYALGQTIAECLGGWRQVPEELMGLLERLTHNLPSRRGSAKALLVELEGEHEGVKYHAGKPGEALALLTLKQVIERIQRDGDGLLLWWEGAPSWQPWEQVPEVTKALQAAQRPTPPPMPARPTPPPMPTLQPKAPPAPTPQPKTPSAPPPSRAVQSSRPKTPSAPPPSRSMQGSPRVGDRIASKVGSVVFHERVIPGVDGGKPFLMMETQVTQALWEAVMGSNPSDFKGARRPVENVSWEDSVEFANALSRKLGLTPAFEGSDNNARFVEGADGFRLPFEAEWAWAAKGGQSFEYAGSNTLSEVGWFRDNSNGKTHDVAQLKPNGYGVYDMSGNVWEWCLDDLSNSGQYRPGAARRVGRGGCWNFFAHGCTVARRGSDSRDSRFSSLGLRLSRSLGF